MVYSTTQLNPQHNAATTVASGLSNITDPVTFVVTADVGPAVPFAIRVENEVLLVTSKAGTSWTVSRAQDGTAAASHANGTTVSCVHSKLAQQRVIDGLIQHTHTGGVDGTVLPGNWVRISELFAASDIPSFSFGSISAAYRQLKFIGTVRTDRAATTDDVRVRFNNDSGANYDSALAYFTTATPGFSELLSATSAQVGYVAGNNATANNPGSFELTIPDYSRAVYKQVAFSQGVAHATDGTAGNTFMCWASIGWKAAAVAINRVDFIPGVGTNFKTGSCIALYGLVA